MTKIVLASSSTYRQDLLKKLGLEFEAVSPRVVETPGFDESPDNQALRLAKEKAAAAAPRFPESLIIGSDQVAVLNGRQLVKPMTRDNAIRQLRESSGQRVAFYTAVSVLHTTTGEMKTDIDRCAVYFRSLDDREIERYVDRERPFDCAGGFKSEGLGIVLFEKFEGEDPNALVGLPLIRLARLLTSFGIRVV
ncbi:Maf family protein [Methylocaldum szegediense]|uniref:7-methyl-GTP pyrophosphatase n=1 Tax=Methylocaldum szegediense TaxID=73780 RepID=A0ABN8X704_9GAMM|nr:nucleoside triphosphate pyrophosphatase [Methylocaldum szegediense]CAI8916409.1 m(7)GTP pyrophosphatase [Methylocaldum szegediense]